MDNLDKAFQLERIGFFKFDRYDIIEDNQLLPVFIQIVGKIDLYMDMMIILNNVNNV
jgi:hypothetical protein